MYSKAVLVAALAGCASAQDYGTSLKDVIAATANSGKFVVGTQATATSLTDASTSTGNDLVNVAAHLSSITTACQDAYHAANSFHGDLSVTRLNDVNFYYAYRYIEKEEYDLHIASVKACLNADNPSTLTQLRADLDTARAAIVPYSGKLDLDWTMMMDDLNTGTSAITLTAAQKANFFNSYLLAFSGGCYEEFFLNNHGTNTAYTLSSVMVAAATDATVLTAINALDTTWSFANWEAWLVYMLQERKKTLLGITPNEWSKIDGNNRAINEAYGFTTATTPTLAQWETAQTSYTTCETRAKNQRDENLENYNGATLNTVGMLGLIMVVLLHL
jgi:hypothetical protein